MSQENMQNMQAVQLVQAESGTGVLVESGEAACESCVPSKGMPCVWQVCGMTLSRIVWDVVCMPSCDSCGRLLGDMKPVNPPIEPIEPTPEGLSLSLW